jgi:hypothetical protein
MAKQIFRKTTASIIVIILIGTNLVTTIQSKIFDESNQLISQEDTSLQRYATGNIEKSSTRTTSIAPSAARMTSSQSYILPDNSNNIADSIDKSKEPPRQGHIAYAWCAYDPSGQIPPGLLYFYLDDPGTLYPVWPGGPSFIGGADFLDESIMYACDYAGGLYMINVDTYDVVYIGPSIGINGLTYDSTTETWYCTSSNVLYIIDVNTGATTSVGSHGLQNTIIDIACDEEGNLYGYDVLWTGESTLYSIDKTTGVATAIGPMGYGFVYAQGCGYDRDNGILYIAGYFNDGTPSALLTCDVTTGTCTVIGNFQGGAEIDGLAIPWEPYHSDHDIAISEITKPVTGNARPITPIVKVKNIGNNTETNVNVQLEIGKELITGSIEDFEATDGGYTHAPMLPQPDAWAWGVPTSGLMAAHSGLNVWATNLAGAYPPSMWCYLVTAPFTVPGNTMFTFWHWYYFENNYDGGNIKISNDSGVTWTLINPIESYPGAMPYNPFMTGQLAYNGQSDGWVQANFDLSAYEGQLVQIMFETASDSSVQYAGWYIDDVGFLQTSWINEYIQTTTIPSIAPDESINVSFPTWIPADLGLVENVDINYNVEAMNIFVDNNTNNDYKEKDFTLHYGYFHDIAVTQIISPVSGLAVPQTPEVVIENHGQFVENVNVNMNIGKAPGVPPAGWGTNYPDNWFSSSTNYAGGILPEAVFYYQPVSVGEHYLWTNNINTTGYTELLLKFKEYVNDYNSDYDLKVVTSTDGGVTWQNVYVRVGGPYGPTTTEVTLTTTNGIGSSTFQIAWDLSGNSYNINYWYIDDVWIGIIDTVEEYDQTVVVDIEPGTTMNVVLPDWVPSDLPFNMEIDFLINVDATLNGFSDFYSYSFEDWIPYTPSAFPPVGWQIYNINGGNQWVHSITEYHSGNGCARCGYDSANNDWLATPGIIVNPGGVFSLWVDTFDYGDDTYQIYMSTVGNTPADFLAGTLLANIVEPVPTVYTQYTFDMSAYVGQMVYFAIRYIGLNAWHICVDDVTLPDGSTQGFEEPGNCFPDWVNYQYGSINVHNQFVGVQTGTNPTCIPHNGSWMAKYGSYNVPSACSALFTKNTPFDFTGATGYNLKFWMIHDNGFSGCVDQIIVCASPDGDTYSFMSGPILRYDATSNTPTWKQHSVDLSEYAGLPAVNIAFYAKSYYGNNMYIDDLTLSTVELLDDGYPEDNMLGTIITLSYEHDAGVIMITEPSWPPQRDLIWDNYADDGTGVGLSSQLDLEYPFNSQCADDFQFMAMMDVTEVHWWGVFFGGDPPWPNPCDFNIIFYADDGSGNRPTGAGMEDPTSTALAVYNFPAVTGVPYDYNHYEYTVTLSPPYVASIGQKYWLTVQAVLEYASGGQWGWATNGGNPDQLSGPVQGFPLLETPYWTATTYGDHAFQLSGQQHQDDSGNWWPGTYPIAGIIQNLGVTYSEINIPVNAVVTNDTGAIVYNETMIIQGPIAPGDFAPVIFPEIIIANESSAEGDYTLTMQTLLADDDHPNNDMKTKAWVIQINDTTPPVTTVQISGTLGKNDWYISPVQLIFTATDGKWPIGVNHTYFKIDDGEWQIYTVPIILDTDGKHTIYFHSDDKAIPPNVEEEKNVSFKMDIAAPVFVDYTFTPLNILKDKWLCSATVEDMTSGIDYVEFYVDGTSVGNDTTEPYEFEFDGKPTNNSQALAYDEAGNSALSPIAQYYEISHQTQVFLQMKETLRTT